MKMNQIPHWYTSGAMNVFGASQLRPLNNFLSYTSMMLNSILCYVHFSVLAAKRLPSLLQGTVGGRV